MNRNLDVWAIQKYPKELYTALENVKTDTGDLILFTNLECNFELNGKKVKRNFDTSLYYDAGNGNDALILLMKDGIETGMSRMRNFQRALIGNGLRLNAYAFSCIIDIDHASDIAKAESFINTHERPKQ